MRSLCYDSSEAMNQRRITALLTLAVMAFLAVLPAGAQRRKKKSDEDFTQTLEVYPDPPSALSVPVNRLSFYLVPMSTKGL